MKKIQVEKTEGEYPSVKLKQDENVSLNINYAGNLDLYFVLEGTTLQNCFEITKEDYVLYEIFLKLYNNIMEGTVYDESLEEYAKAYGVFPKTYNGYLERNKRNRERLKSSNIYKLLTKDGNVTWSSDDYPMEFAPFFQIIKEEDKFIIKFDKGKEKPQDFFSSNNWISVRISNSGSLYHPFNVNFMELFNDLKEMDLEDEQIHLEEYEYLKRVLKK